MRLVAATNNQNKVLEFRRILAPLGFEVRSLEDIGLKIEIEEDADSFLGNARLKAKAVYDRCQMPALSDDSGLCVDALDGRPGVYSARYGGEGLSDAQRVDKLLEEMRDIPRERRGAKFVCAICCVLGPETVLESRGECLGEIGFAPVGTGGFGYDPIFLVDGKSYSEISGREKDEISHRGKALRNMKELLKTCTSMEG